MCKPHMMMMMTFCRQEKFLGQRMQGEESDTSLSCLRAESLRSAPQAPIRWCGWPSRKAQAGSRPLAPRRPRGAQSTYALTHSARQQMFTGLIF